MKPVIVLSVTTGLTIFLVNQIFGVNSLDYVDDTEECAIYIAESSIPEAGLGLFTTKKIKKDEVVGEPDLTLPIVDLKIHLKGEYPNWIHFDYLWEPEWPVEYFLARTVEINTFPIGSLSNFHTTLFNVSPGPIRYKDDILSRLKDPGAGAFSYHFEKNFTADRTILPGEEIFADYGETWLDDHFLDDVPRKENYDRLEQVLRIIPKYLETDAHNKYDDFSDESTLKLIKEVVEIFDVRTATMMPKTDGELHDLAMNGIGWNTVNRRTPEWIRENGQCVDHIKADISTIPQAGRGAFAKHFIRKGELIAPLPFVQILDKSTVNMYELIKGANNKIYADYDHMTGKQLLLNYCFSHQQSTLLLCPTSHAALINHKSDKAKENECYDGPNAYYRWSEWDNTTQEWLTLSLEDMEEREGRGLAFEIIALIDIQPGEEIFIDYGEEWEIAWQNHINNWKPPTGEFRDFLSAERMNIENYEIRAEGELLTNPYPSNIMLGCLYWEFDDDDSNDDSLDQNEVDEVILHEDEDQNIHWSETSIDDQIRRYSSSAEMLDFSESDHTEYWPCKVYETNYERDIFTVRIFQSPHVPSTSWTRKDEPHYVTNMPREALRFFDSPRRSDMFLPGAFRYPIGIRDDIFPDQWKNLDKMKM